VTGKNRSRNYPAFGLGEAIQRARELYERDGKAAVSTEVAVQAWNYRGLNGASLRTLAAVRQYGLLDDAAPKTVRLSARALTILLEPEDSPARAQAMREAATAPAVFKELREQYGNDLPSDAALISHLVRNENFSEGAAKNLIAAFRDTLALVSQAPKPDITPSRDQQGGGGQGHSGKDRQPPPRHKGEGVHMEFNWPLSGDAVATLTVSRELEPDDVETLAAYLEIAKKTLAKAARVRTITPLPEQPSAS
jgi:hypothetical protein